MNTYKKYSSSLFKKLTVKQIEPIRLPASGYSTPEKKHICSLLPFPFYFDREDRALLKMVNDMLDLPPGLEPAAFDVFDPALHPHGIKCMTVSREMRIAYAVVHLLKLLESGKLEDRLKALRTLRDEGLHTSSSTLRLNTGRVLIQIMKELVRASGDTLSQLMLARDFRLASSGRPRLVRIMLDRYNLLEMPEDESQLTFDEHVHDSHTKGRKTPTHLIMDAWIKGIKKLTVIYYNHVTPASAQEVLEAGRIMGIRARVGIEFLCPFYSKRVKLIWLPFRHATVEEFCDFLNLPRVAQLMSEGLKASWLQEKITFELLSSFNANHLPSLNEEFEITLAPLTAVNFDCFVNEGQASRLHLAEFIYLALLPLIERRSQELSAELEEASAERKVVIQNILSQMEDFEPEDILSTYLSPGVNPRVTDPDNLPSSPDMPLPLRLSPVDLLELLSSLRPESDFVLTLTNLHLVDAAEILFEAKGRITHLELFSYKDYILGRTPQPEQISLFQQALNSGDLIALKRSLLQILTSLRLSTPCDQVRCLKFEEILRSIQKFQAFYLNRPLRSCLGSDSSGRSKQFLGMGLAFANTLPLKARQRIAAKKGTHVLLPIRGLAHPRADYLPRAYYSPVTKKIVGFLSFLPGLTYLAYSKTLRWVMHSNTFHFSGKGNIISLGSGGANPLVKNVVKQTAQKPVPLSLRYANTHLLNATKVFLGLFLATATFMYTQNWWFLAFFGGAIWLLITYFRNIAQAVFGGGGFSRPSTLHWHDFVNWNRIADSLFFTGLSVPLLELGVRVLFLKDTLNLTVSDSPLLVYTVISLVNGVYIAWHNLYRGLPKEAAIGNLFRSVLAIPTAMLLNTLLFNLLGLFGVSGVQIIMEHTAAILSKLSSDIVAAVIEGLSDRAVNRRMRVFDYRQKIRQLLNTYIKLEMLLPESNILNILKNPEQDLPLPSREASALKRTLYICVLDLMYFWYYQPRAREVLKKIMRKMSSEEREVFLGLQNLLLRREKIAELIKGGLLGPDFAKPLVFFEHNAQDYVHGVNRP